MMVRPIFAAAMLAAAIAGCNQRSNDDSSFSFKAGGTAVAANSAAGSVAIDTPLFKGKFNMPGVNLTADNFDIDGVHLYPGSKIANVDVNATGDRDGVVRLRFSSPASPQTVRDWMLSEFTKHGTEARADGDGIRGKTDDKPFRIDLTPADDRTTGLVTIG